MKFRLYKLIANGLGTGLLPLAPGTWGAALAVLLVCPLAYLNPLVANLLLTGLVLAGGLLGVKASEAVIPEWGKDPKKVVIDEMVGVWIALLGLPLANVYYLLAGFVLFRFFDIAKPLGIREAEKVGGGWGIMLDDVLAGVYANIVLQIARLIINN